MPSLNGGWLRLSFGITEYSREITHEPDTNHSALNQHAASVERVCFPTNQIELGETIECAGDCGLGNIKFLS
jgi:hypothetical protein